MSTDKPAHEIRVSGQTRIGGALRHIYAVLEDEKKSEFVIIRGAGQAIPQVVALVELVKHRIAGLHQNTEITTVDTEETNRDGETYTRHLTMLKVTLSFKATVDTDAPGYTKPINAELIEPYVVRSAEEQAAAREVILSNLNTEGDI